MIVKEEVMHDAWCSLTWKYWSEVKRFSITSCHEDQELFSQTGPLMPLGVFFFVILPETAKVPTKSLKSFFLRLHAWCFKNSLQNKKKDKWFFDLAFISPVFVFVYGSYRIKTLFDLKLNTVAKQRECHRGSVVKEEQEMVDSSRDWCSPSGMVVLRCGIVQPNLLPRNVGFLD